jgi:dipeptidyl-peptidase 4
MTDTFPRQYARTRHLTLGEPRNIVVSPDGSRVVFLRSRGGDDPVNCLWVMDPHTGAEQLVADPLLLLVGSDEADLPAEERVRRERAREGAGGIVSFATDAAVSVACFSLAGRLFTAGLITASARELEVPGPVFDPRPDPTATRIAYTRSGSLRVATPKGTHWELADDDDENVTWGVADFIAAEEMGRSRGFWWSPEGTHLAVARVDNSPVQRWWLSNPAEPSIAPTSVAYPAAGTPNAIVGLFVVDLDGERVEVNWDRAELPYLAAVSWSSHGLFIVVQSRDQKRVEVRTVTPATGATYLRLDDVDKHWVELVPGTPTFMGDGQLVTCADRGGSRRLMIDGEPVTLAPLQVRSVLHADHDSVVFTGNFLVDPVHHHVYRWHTNGKLDRLTEEPGVHTAVVGGPTVVLRSATIDRDGTMTRVMGDATLVASYAETALVQPNVQFIDAGDRSLVTALILPRDIQPGQKLPVLLDPYGGPHAQRAIASRGAFLTSQWFADQGFAVIVTDGRGTPGRGSAWERSVSNDLATAVLEDQIDALEAVASQFPELDLSRVGIRGWSFGGYLAALAVMRNPETFHCAIAGAPVTDWRLYDTHYTERYLGDPATNTAAYDRSSLLHDAAGLERPLLLIHGLADDNVYAAHTLQLSSALMAAGRPHTVLPLTGVSHMTPQEVVAENLLHLQLQFLREHLGMPIQGDPNAADPPTEPYELA